MSKEPVIIMPKFEDVFNRGIEALPPELEIHEFEPDDPHGIMIADSELAALVTMNRDLTAYFTQTMAGEEPDIDLVVACTEALTTLDVLAIIATARMRTKEIRLGIAPKVDMGTDRREALIERLTRAGVPREEAESSVDSVLKIMNGGTDGEATKDGSVPGQPTSPEEVLDESDAPEEEGKKPLPMQW